jgi:succinate-semialdehyde dehydrogenase/glutarate-semialdehyde dehydrogenase
VSDAISKGATLLAGGRRNPDLKGLFFEPTVLADVTHDMRVMQDETFGPVLPIMRVQNTDEAIRFANQTRYGLAANVWTQNKRRGFAIAERLNCGSVCINDMSITYGVPEAPFGGLRESGVGQIHGWAGMRAYAHAQPVLTNRFGGRPPGSSYPYLARNDKRLQKVIRVLYSTPLGRWLS